MRWRFTPRFCSTLKTTLKAVVAMVWGFILLFSEDFQAIALSAGRFFRGTRLELILYFVGLFLHGFLSARVGTPSTAWVS